MLYLPLLQGKLAQNTYVNKNAGHIDISKGLLYRLFKDTVIITCIVLDK